MIRVLLLHADDLPHYRVPIYGYLSKHLSSYGFDLTVASDSIQQDNPHPVEFSFVPGTFSIISIAKLLYRVRPHVVIMFVGMRHLYLFPTYILAKGLLRLKMVWWGQGRDLADRDALVKNVAYGAEHALCDAIILYADHLKQYVAKRFHPKIFVAANTLLIRYEGLPDEKRASVLEAYGIHTRKNIICVGRLQRRKRLDHLISAMDYMNRPDIGLILVGPDTDGVLDGFEGKNIFKLGPIYGDARYDLMSAADVYCLPGAVGLSVVDAFHCGLPMVTEEGDESAEMMYVKDGVNGFIVRRGDIKALAERLLLLLDDDEVRQRFSEAAKEEISTSGHIDRLCAGFTEALRFATGLSVEAPRDGMERKVC